MPELPEVETVMRGIAPHLVGRRILRFVARRPDLRNRLPADLARRVEGRRVDALTRRAKYILIRLAPAASAAPPGVGAPAAQGGVAGSAALPASAAPAGPAARARQAAPAAPGDGIDFLLIHLGMSGRLLVGPDDGRPPGRHEHVAFATDGGSEIRFSDPRRFGLVDLVPAARLASDPRFAGLGPEPLSDAFDAAALEAAFAGSRTAVKLALLDQRRVAGVGNIYACEALFRAGISPRREAGTVRGPRARRLVAAIKDVLGEAIAAGGSSARDYVQASGEAGWFQHRWAVYDREGEPCPGCDCGGAVRRFVQAGRSTFCCPRRQR